jgi:hypothetical protein
MALITGLLFDAAGLKDRQEREGKKHFVLQ